MNTESIVSTISVVCPTYNSADYVEKTIESVLAQTVAPLEFLVIDDGSTDRTCEIIQSFITTTSRFPIRLFKSAHLGPGAARNTGILNAQGAWIAFIDSDDQWYPGKLQSVIKVISAHSDINLICHAEMYSDRYGHQSLLDFGARYNTQQPIFPQLYRNNFLSPSAVTCTKQLLIDVNLFDPTFMTAQDYELWLRMSAIMHPYFIREPLGVYFERVGNISTSNAFLRIKNNIRIALLYRSKVSVNIFLYKLFIVLRSAIWQWVRTCGLSARDLLKRTSHA